MESDRIQVFFLLFSGLVVLRNIISYEKYLHFLSLHIAVRILSCAELCNRYIMFAHNLLLYFVDKVKVIYGFEYVSHNVHGLTHIVDDVKIYGTLDLFSAFPFENYLQYLKKLLRKPNEPLSQIIR